MDILDEDITQMIQRKKQMSDPSYQFAVRKSTKIQEEAIKVKAKAPVKKADIAKMSVHLTDIALPDFDGGLTAGAYDANYSYRSDLRANGNTPRYNIEGGFEVKYPYIGGGICKCSVYCYDNVKKSGKTYEYNYEEAEVSTDLFKSIMLDAYSVFTGVAKSDDEEKPQTDIPPMDDGVEKAFDEEMPDADRGNNEELELPDAQNLDKGCGVKKDETKIPVSDKDSVEIEEMDGEKYVEIEPKEEHDKEVETGYEKESDDLNTKDNVTHPDTSVEKDCDPDDPDCKEDDVEKSEDEPVEDTPDEPNVEEIEKADPVADVCPAEPESGEKEDKLENIEPLLEDSESATPISDERTDIEPLLEDSQPVNTDADGKGEVVAPTMPKSLDEIAKMDITEMIQAKKNANAVTPTVYKPVTIGHGKSELPFQRGRMHKL